MDFFDDPKFKFTYEKCKFRVKVWEINFLEKYGRKPTKGDIKLADEQTRDSYKLYWKLKTKAFDETLIQNSYQEKTENDILSKNDGSKQILSVEQAQSQKKVYSLMPYTPVISYSNNEFNKIQTFLSTFSTSQNIYGTWDGQLNVEKQCINKNHETIFCDKSLFQLSTNMCQSFKFSKRNPRKTLHISKMYNNSKRDLNLSLNEFDKNIDPHLGHHICNKKLQTTVTNEKKMYQSFNTIQQLIEKCPIKINNNELYKNSSVTCTNEYPLDSITKVLNLSLNKSQFHTYINCISSNTINSAKEFLDDEHYFCNSDSKDRRYKRIRTLDNISDHEEQTAKKLCIDNNSIFDSGKEMKKDMLNCTHNSNKQKKNIKKINNKDTDIENKFYFEPKQEMLRKNNTNFNENRYEKEIQSNLNTNLNTQILATTTSNVISNLREKTISSFGVEDYLSVSDFSWDNSQKSSQLTNKEKFQCKMSAGKLNENYVKINLKKKIFVRGKRSFSLSTIKKRQWKKKKRLDKFLTESAAVDIDKYSKIICLKCRKSGHSSRFCESIDNEKQLTCKKSFTFSRSFEVQNVADKHLCKNVISSPYTFGQFPARLCNNSETHNFICNESAAATVSDNVEMKLLSQQIEEVHQLYQKTLNTSIKDTPTEVLSVLKQFGHDQFRAGQDQTILRILSGKSTLLTLATGSGKSLCYQLPAYIYAKGSKCITLVISPLISLMEDQVSNTPDFLSAACLHTNQNSKERAKVLDNLKENKLDILFVSPETIVMQENSNIFRGSTFPPIAFVCIDEVHCISQWSHNFRPSFLHVCKILKETLNVKCFLGLTATATKAAIMSILNILEIEDGMAGVIIGKPIPINLHLTLSQDINREQALLTLLNSQKFSQYKSIIVYCTRRAECDRIAELIRLSLIEIESASSYTTEKYLKLSMVAEAYHAGLSVHRRKMVQNAFMKSKIRIIVSTIAFGMGINKLNIRAVIHFNMPASFENYVQEIGRAGRDGLPAFCHLFLNAQENADELELRRHINANGLDRHTIRRLLKKIFVPCNCSDIKTSVPNLRCPGHEVCFSIEETIRTLDISEEIILTLFSYLDLHRKRFIKLLSPTYMHSTVISHGGPKVLKVIAQSSAPLAKAMDLSTKSGAYNNESSEIRFPVDYVATTLGCNSSMAINYLKKLEWISENGKWIPTGLSVQFDTPCFRMKAPGDLTSDELDEILEYLIETCENQAKFCFGQLQFISKTARTFSFDSVKESMSFPDIAKIRSENFKITICNYFELDDPLSHICSPSIEVKLQNEAEIIKSIRHLVFSYKDNNFTGRSVARIFHGIQSPNYPAVIWSKCCFWRAHISSDFNALCKLAAQEILKIK